MKLNKKAINEVGIGIVMMALLLLIGAMFFDSPTNSKQIYLEHKNTTKNSNNIQYGQQAPENTYLFYLKDIDIGRQKKVTESYPNIELGSKEQNNIIYIGSSFNLLANPFTSNSKTFNVNVKNAQDINEVLLYFKSNRISGDNDVIVKFGDQEVMRTLAKESDIPIKIQLQHNNNFSYIPISMEIEKPKFYNIFNWNKIEFSDFKVVEVRQDKSNNVRDFDFDVSKDFLERMYIDLTISCDEIKETSAPIKVMLNGYITSNENPKCTSRYARITTNNISLSIIKSEKNRLTFETDGYYKIAYAINKIYYNDQETYKFNINSFNDIIDVVMYGDFDKDPITLRLNGNTMNLGRNEIKSIVQYLKYGKNELEFLTKPIELKEFIIEKNELGFNN